MAALSVCFLSSVQYSEPLDSTSEKKYRALKALGEILVIGFSHGLKPRAFVQEARFRLLPWLPTPVLRYSLLFTVGSIFALLATLRHGCQVIVAQSPYEGVAAAIVRAVARLAGRRVALVVESHGDFEISPFLQRRTRFPRVYRYLIPRLSGFALRRGDALRAISDSTRRQLELWVPGRPIVQFPTWTDIEPFLNAGNARVERDRENTFLYVGVLIARKAVDVLVAAFAKAAEAIPDARLVIIGRAEDPAYERLLLEKVNALGVASRVSFLPPTSQAELAEHMVRASALVLPSVSEGLGRVVFEAMACGTPVIGSHVGGIVEMVVDGDTGFLVEPGREEPLAEKMAWVLSHPSDARVMGMKAREFARRFFSTESYVSGYKRLLETAAESAASGGPRAR
jgi:glycosyltransferase involved in cell wall biosynthesis